MEKLILHPTDISQWHALVNEAQVATRLILNEETESYLVFLLMRFIKTRKLCESVLALDFLASKHAFRTKQVSLLRDVGDKSLLFCGLFPGIADTKHVSLEYFRDLGQSAYLSVSELDEKIADLYYDLSAQFVNLQQILQAMRGSDPRLQDICSENLIAKYNKTLQ